ncbi:MAG: SDR family NAD(P)-dependent oxidoreductase [Proteobacteria bacterium]|nr:SDR family NAD(P)-dependent oxidoreductase [Pseudomonadota bacterium]
MNQLYGERAVITGAASGLGRALALVLAGKGWKIGIADVNDAGSRETLELVERAGGSGEVFHADVSKPESVKEMADHFYSKWKAVDILVNNAGIAISGVIGDIPLENWKRIVDINFWGVLYGCHEFIPRMKAQGGGYILNIASAAGLLSMTNMGPYNVTKAAVISLSESLKVEMAPLNIGITVACPMFFNTNLVKDMKHTDPWETEFANAAFQYSRISSDEVARRIIKAVEKGKLYVVPMLSGKVFWANKRLSPSLYYHLMAFMHKHGWLRAMSLKIARWGLV